MDGQLLSKMKQESYGKVYNDDAEGLGTGLSLGGLLSGTQCQNSACPSRLQATPSNSYLTMSLASLPLTFSIWTSPSCGFL